MKIAVYTICKNESQFVARWLESCKDADHILIVDTGSTDDTRDVVNLYQAEYKQLHFWNKLEVKPWRFDDARNFSLQLLPTDVDICICLDMDEILTDGWRGIVEDAYNRERFSRLRYNYVWSHDHLGQPAVTYYADKIHVRHGFRWVNPVHEVLHFDQRLGPEKQTFIDDTLIVHYPDSTKSRSQYLDLLALAVSERPHDDRNMHYYARDLMYAKRYSEAIEYFQKHLVISSWDSERAASMRYMGDCYFALQEYGKAEHWFIAATLEVTGEREPKVALAQFYRWKDKPELVIKYCEEALAITERPNSYINQPVAWSNWPQEMLDEARSKVST